MFLAILSSVLIAAAILVILVRPRAGLMVLVVFYPLQFFVPGSPVPGLNAETVLAVVAVVGTVARCGFRLPPLSVLTPIAAYMALLVIGWYLTWAWYPGNNPLLTHFDNAKTVKNLVFAAILFYPIYMFFSERGDRRKLLECVSAGVALAGLLAIGDFILGTSRWAAEGRAAGLLRDPNMHAAFLGCLSLVSLCLIGDREIPLWRRGFHAVAYGIAMLTLILTLSRGGWAAALTGHFVWFALVNRRMLVVGSVALMLAATIAYPLVPSIVRERIEATFETTGSVYRVGGAVGLEASAGSRVALWKSGIDMFIDAPLLGHGLGGYFLKVPQYGAGYGILRNRDPHNLIVKVAAESGIVGLAVLIWIVVLTFRIGFGIFRYGREDWRFGALILAFAANLGMANMFAGVAYTSAVVFYFWVLLALGVHARERLRAEPEVRLTDSVTASPQDA